MNDFANLKTDERADVFTQTASRMKTSNVAIVEKDFWVCYVLKHLFETETLKDKIVFKGGTSLSKAFDLINRFSEDVDLILDWRALGYELKEPWQPRSNTQQDLFNKDANHKVEKYIETVFLPAINDKVGKHLKEPFKFEIDPDDKQTVLFLYPRKYSDNAILPEVRLEIGALATWTPSAKTPISPYSAKYFPYLFKEPSIEIITVLPERTFWEKITILHRESFRPEGSPLPHRYSRHYYDVYCMMNSPVKEKALKGLALLEKVVSFKDKFYHSPWGRYDLAKPGSIRLMPPEHNIQALRSDYEQMLGMLYGVKPTFDEIMGSLARLEEEINRR